MYVEKCEDENGILTCVTWALDHVLVRILKVQDGTDHQQLLHLGCVAQFFLGALLDPFYASTGHSQVSIKL